MSLIFPSTIPPSSHATRPLPPSACTAPLVVSTWCTFVCLAAPAPEQAHLPTNLIIKPPEQLRLASQPSCSFTVPSRWEQGGISLSQLVYASCFPVYAPACNFFFHREAGSCSSWKAMSSWRPGFSACLSGPTLRTLRTRPHHQDHAPAGAPKGPQASVEESHCCECIVMSACPRSP